MKNSSKKFLTIIAAAVLSLSQYGCLSDLLAPTADPTVFHVISPVQIEKKYDCKCDVNLQAAQLPQYMSRQQIVSLAESRILLVSEFDRWAELPSDGFERALAVDIESSGVASVFMYPAVSPAAEKACSLRIFVYECLGKIDGKVVLKGKWQLDAPNNSKSVVKNFSFETSSNDGYGGYARAINKLIAELAGQISAEISKF